MRTYRVDTVGSLLRPDYLKEARRQHETGEISDAAFKRVEDRAVDEAVRLQIEAGLDVITDGELRRYAFFGHLIDAVEGFDRLGGWAIPFHDDAGSEIVFPRPVVVDRLKRRRHLCAEEFSYLRARANGHPAKATIISAQRRRLRLD
jgi:5-methyltetrahydropteroyltriglutamate--homocysteine methyltransferase